MIPLKKILSLFDPKDRPRIYLLVLLIGTGAVLETLGVGLVMPFIAVVSDPTILETNAALEKLHSLAGRADYKTFLIYCGAGLLAFYLLKNLYLASLYYLQNRFIFSRMLLFAERLFSAYLSSPYSFHIQRNSSDLQKNINHNMQILFQLVVLPTFTLLGDSLVVIILTSMLIAVEPLSSLLAVVILGTLSLAFVKLLRKSTSGMGSREQASIGQMIKWVDQGLGGIKELKVLRAEKFFISQFSRSYREFAKSRRVILTLNEMPRLFLEAVAVSGLLIIITVMLIQDKSMRESFPIMALFAAATFRLIPAVTRILRSYHFIQHYRPTLDILKLDLAIDREPGKKGLPSDLGTQNDLPVRFADRITLENLSFSYSGSDVPVLDRIDLALFKGESAAFVGTSGAGKTTIVDIILGLLQPTEGRVAVDGIDIRTDISGWRRNFGYIPQTIFLLDDSIRRNIAFGINEEEIDDRMVSRAANMAQLGKFIEKLPGKYETSVGELGAKLSGGQRQRLGIARALYHNPDVIVMDEATSSLDYETEKAVTEAITSLSGQKTIIIIAHRLSTVKECDRLFFLKDGKIAACGTYLDLMEKSPDFRNMAGLNPDAGSRSVKTDLPP